MGDPLIHCILGTAYFYLLGSVLFPIRVSAQTHCAGYHQFWDGRSCSSCTRRSCSIGSFRETCSPSSTRDAACIPCSPPPPNAVHVTGGLPYMQDNCMWACLEGYYRSGDTCEACNMEPCSTGTAMVREVCSRGSTRDAGCVCQEGHFMDEEGGCTPCAHTSCPMPEYETLVGCPGSTNRDVSRCVRNVVEETV